MKKSPRNYKRGGKMFAYILDSVYSDEIDTESMTDKERIEFLLDTFLKKSTKTIGAECALLNFSANGCRACHLLLV